MGEAREGAIDVVIDPGHAFGTGAHPTTRLCLELLLELADAGEAGRPRRLGHGLGRARDRRGEAGLRPGRRPATTSGRRSRRPARTPRANGVELELHRANLRVEPPPRAPTVVANLTAPVLSEIAGRLDRAPERLICSGLLASEAEEAREAFAMPPA